MGGPHLLVINPQAGRGHGIEVAWRVERLYREAGLAVEVRRTAGKADAAAIARAAARSHAAIVAVGGDGTFHEVASGVADAAREAGSPDAVAAVAAIPVGTGNDFVKSLAISPEPEAAFAVVRDGRRRRIDLGRFRTEPSAPARWFANQIQVGYGAEVVHDMAAPRSIARRFFPGHYAYMAAGLARMGFATREIAVLRDGEERRGRFFEVHIANGRYCGGGISYAPDADLGDGLLDLVTIDAMAIHRVVSIMLEVKAARRVESPGVTRARTKAIVIRDAAPFWISADGEADEVVGGRLEVEVAAGAVEVMAP